MRYFNFFAKDFEMVCDFSRSFQSGSAKNAMLKSGLLGGRKSNNKTK